jgi:hypothetical protein
MNMWDALKSVLKQYAGSKKAIATFAAIAAWVAGKAGLGLDSAELAGAIGPLWLYIVSQAVADHGKEAKKLEAPKS